VTRKIAIAIVFAGGIIAALVVGNVEPEKQDAVVGNVEQDTVTVHAADWLFVPDTAADDYTIAVDGRTTVTVECANARVTVRRSASEVVP